MEEYFKYLSIYEQTLLKKFKLCENIEKLKKGSEIKYLIKKNLKFVQTNYKLKNIRSNYLELHVCYKHKKVINFNKNVIFYKNKIKKGKKFNLELKYILEGLRNKTIIL